MEIPAPCERALRWLDCTHRVNPEGLPVAIHFACPACNATMTAPDGRAGSKGPCPKCGQRLQVPNPVRRTIVGKLVSVATRRRPAPVVAPVAERVPIVPCPHCQGKLAVRPELLGQVLQCVHCKGKAQLASTASGLALLAVSPFADLPVVTPAVDGSDWSVDLEEDRPRPRRRERDREAGVDSAGAGSVVLGSVALFLALLPMFSLMAWFRAGTLLDVALVLSIIGMLASIPQRTSLRVAGGLLSLLACAASLAVANHVNEVMETLRKVFG
jgi:hypothetical protein